MDEMTLAQAVAILNREKHAGREWIIGSGVQNSTYVYCETEFVYFTPFEAIAIAREYERLRLAKAGEVSPPDAGG